MIPRLLIALIRVYQHTLSRVTPAACRFHPSCSNYAVHCLAHFGAVRGGSLTLRRILRCHPFHPGGFDPPPEAEARLPASSTAHGP